MAYRYTVTNPASHHNVGGAGPGSLSSSGQVANANQVLAKPPLPCRRPLAGEPALLEEALVGLVGEFRDKVRRFEHGLGQLVQSRARIGVDVVTVQDLNRLEKVPLHWLGGVGGWSLDLDFLHYLRGVLDRYEHPRVLEFGSGRGTKTLARLCANRGGTLLTVEHDAEWRERTTQDLAGADLAGHASVRLAPLVDSDFFGIATRFYDMSWLTEDNRFDVVIVDGPPTDLGTLVRVSGLPAVAAHLSPDFRVFLDDFDREEERKVAEIWAKVAPDLRYRTLQFAKAVCEVAPR